MDDIALDRVACSGPVGAGQGETGLVRGWVARMYRENSL